MDGTKDPKTATDVLVAALEACSDGDAEIAMVIFAKKDGSIAGWSCNEQNPFLRAGLCVGAAVMAFNGMKEME